MTHDFQPDEETRRSQLLFRHGWEGVIFFGGLAICLGVVLLSQYLWV